VLLAVACLGLAACGSSSKSSSTTTTSAAASTGGRARFTQLRQCLQKSGINLPPRAPGAGRPPGGGGGFLGGGGSGGPALPAGVTRAQLQAAMTKCGAGARFGQRRVNSPAFRQAVTAYATCMRQNGVKLPAPNTSGNGPVFSTSGINRNDPKFKAANTKCESKLRGVFPGRTGSAGSAAGGGGASTQ
jgi:hypothetical protein